MDLTQVSFIGMYIDPSVLFFLILLYHQMLFSFYPMDTLSVNFRAQLAESKVSVCLSLKRGVGGKSCALLYIVDRLLHAALPLTASLSAASNGVSPSWSCMFTLALCSSNHLVDATWWPIHA